MHRKYVLNKLICFKVLYKQYTYTIHNFSGDEDEDEVSTTNEESNSDDDDPVEQPSCSKNVFSLLEND